MKTKFDDLYEDTMSNLIIDNEEDYSIYVDEENNLIEIDELDDEEVVDKIDYVSEKMLKRKVIRKGKKMTKFTTNKAKHKIVMQGGKPKEVKMTPKEIKNRKKASKKSAKKRKAKSSNTANTSRKLSMKKRGALGSGGKARPV